jgi:hypothetical protein
MLIRLRRRSKRLLLLHLQRTNPRIQARHQLGLLGDVLGDGFVRIDLLGELGHVLAELGVELLEFLDGCAEFLVLLLYPGDGGIGFDGLGLNFDGRGCRLGRLPTELPDLSLQLLHDAVLTRQAAFQLALDLLQLPDLLLLLFDGRARLD